jgi:predicted double-glycine peptidase
MAAAVNYWTGEDADKQQQMLTMTIMEQIERYAFL